MWNWADHQIELVLIRHGATESNEERRYIGKTDESLSKEGISALCEAKSMKNYPEVQYVFSSPMKRCMETAEVLYPEKTPVVIPEWEEMDFGAFEGKNYMDLRGDKRYQEWVDSYGTLPFPEGESREDFASRCDIGFRKMIDLLSQSVETELCECKTVGAVVHGGTIMALLSRYGGGDYFDYQVPNGEGYQCLLRYHDLGAPKVNIEGIQIANIRKIQQTKYM